MSLLIIIIQLFWWYSAKKDAGEETSWSYPFRMFIWPIPFDEQTEVQSEKAHNQGALSVGSLWVLTSLLFTGCMYAYEPWYFLIVDFVLCFTCCLLTYWRYFDVAYSKGIGKKRFYLGGTAKLDKRLVKKYGEDKAGEKKAAFCLIGIVLSDAIIILLNFLLCISSS